MDLKAEKSCLPKALTSSCFLTVTLQNYAGIAIIENCEILLPGGIVDEDVDIQEPIIFEKEIRIPPKDVDIRGIHFVPYRSWSLPGRIHMKCTKESDIVKAAGCCAFRIARDLI